MPRRKTLTTTPLPTSLPNPLILVSDFHLSDRVPACRRSAGSDCWLEHQRMSLLELGWTDAPIICAGDVFDEPYKNPERPSPALINMTLQALKDLEFYTIPGQHDLPGHNMDLIHKTALHTLSLAGCATILNCLTNGGEYVNGWLVLGWPWGMAPHPDSLKDLGQSTTRPILAVTHRMTWAGTPPYPGAPEEGNADAIAEEFKGATVVLTGDNHKPFVHYPKREGLPIVINPGSLMRIRSDQTEPARAYIVSYDEDTLKVNIWLKPMPDSLVLGEAAEADDNLPHERARFRPFVEALNSQGRACVSYESNIRRVLDEVKPARGVRVRVLDSLKGT